MLQFHKQNVYFYTNEIIFLLFCFIIIFYFYALMCLSWCIIVCKCMCVMAFSFKIPRCVFAQADMMFTNYSKGNSYSYQLQYQQYHSNSKSKQTQTASKCSKARHRKVYSQIHLTLLHVMRYHMTNVLFFLFNILLYAHVCL